MSCSISFINLLGTDVCETPRDKQGRSMSCSRSISFINLLWAAFETSTIRDINRQKSFPISFIIFLVKHRQATGQYRVFNLFHWSNSHLWSVLETTTIRDINGQCLVLFHFRSSPGWKGRGRKSQYCVFNLFHLLISYLWAVLETSTFRDINDQCFVPFYNSWVKHQGTTSHYRVLDLFISPLILRSVWDIHNPWHKRSISCPISLLISWVKHEGTTSRYRGVTSGQCPVPFNFSSPGWNTEGHKLIPRVLDLSVINLLVLWSVWDIHNAWHLRSVSCSISCFQSTRNVPSLRHLHPQPVGQTSIVSNHFIMWYACPPWPQATQKLLAPLTVTWQMMHWNPNPLQW